MINRALLFAFLLLGCYETTDKPRPNPPARPSMAGNAGMVPTITIRSGNLTWEAVGCCASAVNRGEADCSGLLSGIDGEEIARIWMDIYGNVQIGSPTLQVEGRAQVKCWDAPADEYCTPWTRDVRDTGEDR